MLGGYVIFDAESGTAPQRMAPIRVLSAEVIMMNLFKKEVGPDISGSEASG